MPYTNNFATSTVALPSPPAAGIIGTTVSISQANQSHYAIASNGPSSGILFNNGGSTSDALAVTGTVTASDFKIDGVSVKDTINAINDRLAILVPDIAKMEKYAALKAAYEQYKLLEKLCTE